MPGSHFKSRYLIIFTSCANRKRYLTHSFIKFLVLASCETNTLFKRVRGQLMGVLPCIINTWEL